MTRVLHHAAFVTGLAAVGWTGAGYIGSNPLALAMIGIIAAFYLMGALELHRFDRATSTLSRALTELRDPPATLGQWLEPVHPSLRNAVRLRIEGERIALPGPAMTPYLAGLLVLLGMLGTFLGMVVTLDGTGAALDSATDLQSVRASLAAPVKGLGLAFGTSVAGIAASAMLGLMSALCRRARLQAAQSLDATIATTLHAFSLAHRRDESLRLLQLQAQGMPDLVERMDAMMVRMERQSEALNDRLVASQEGFRRAAEAGYARLAASVDASLKHSLTESARIAGATIQPVVEATMAGITRETASLHHAIADTVQRQLEGVSQRFDAATTGVADTWTTALAQHQRTGDELLAGLRRAHVDLQAALASRDEQRLAAWTQALASSASSLQQEWQQAGAQTLAQQQQICRTLEQTARDITSQAEAHARSTLAELARLAQAASEAPRAAADVVAELRHQLSESMARDNAVLEERSRIMETLRTLLDALNQASAEQRATIDGLVASSSAWLEQAGTRFTEQVDAESRRMAEVAAQVTGSAVEVASLGEAFGFAVQLFSESNDKLTAQLQRIESALSRSIARSDEQLAYYVAQAREVIDLSIMSQKQIVEDLQQFSGSRAPALDPAA